MSEAPTTEAATAGSGARLRDAWQRYWYDPLPVERMAVFARIIHATVLFTVFRTDRWMVGHAIAPEEYYQPVAISRLLGIPAPTPTTMTLLQWVIFVSAALSIAGVGSRAVRHVLHTIVALSYTQWILWGFSYAKVDHDRLTIIVALFVLAVVPGVGTGDDPQVRWGLRTVQAMWILSYPASAIAKMQVTGPDWMSSAVLARAIVRRGTSFGDLFVDHAAFLRLCQWAAVGLEFAATLALFPLRRIRAVLLVSLVMLHVLTWFVIGIHFLPHTICVTSFLPLERLHPRWRAGAGAGLRGAGRGRRPPATGGARRRPRHGTGPTPA